MRAASTAARLLLALGPACAACGPAGPATPGGTEGAEARAAQTVERLLDGLLDLSPSRCRGLGLHDRGDGRVADYSAAGIAARERFLAGAHEQLEALGPLADPDHELDRRLLDLTVQNELFELEELSQWQRRPAFYEELFSVDDYLTRDYAPLDTRAAALLRHVNAALPQTEHVLANLKGPLPRAFVETDIGVYKGYAEYLRGDVATLLADVKDAALRDAAIGATSRLAARAEAIAAQLEKVELPRADESHVLGEARFRKLLAVQDGLTMDLGELERMAEEDLAKNKRAYEALVAEGVKERRPAAGELLGVATEMTAKSRAFLEQKGIVSIPEEGKLLVRESPPYMRWNSAFLSGPGPFDAPSLPAYYYITLPDPKWPAAEREAYIMPFGTLLATSVHEVYPGHFLHGLWIRRAPTRAQKALRTYSFVEGWAHYTEQMMVEEGFGARWGGTGASRAPADADDKETRLGQLGDALLRNCRVVGAIALHTKGATTGDVARRFEQDCKQDPATAKQQARRGTFDPGYYAYTLGKLQIYALRAKARDKLGPRFDLRRFHDALLSHGAPPVALIEQRVLDDLAR